ncbi:hypothetical protein V6N11_022130 [Hibiscus sabdariffa]|uniref:RNase H type-1 domain-containing protein n=1 Tax=Hibiscus sabdariffa TaxID=183260 RepID=A0ABR2TI91_9ROSI
MSDPSIADNLSLIGNDASCVLAWKAPPSGFFKLNVDGAKLRNDAVGQGTPVLVELLALSYGLGFFFRSDWGTSSRLVLESDSLIAVEWVFHPDKCPPMFASLTRSIRSVIDEKHVILRHIPRGCNVEADALAKAGIG